MRFIPSGKSLGDENGFSAACGELAGAAFQSGTLKYRKFSSMAPGSALTISMSPPIRSHAQCSPQAVEKQLSMALLCQALHARGPEEWVLFRFGRVNPHRNAACPAPLVMFKQTYETQTQLQKSHKSSTSLHRFNAQGLASVIFPGRCF